jgi:hypothetical protein
VLGWRGVWNAEERYRRGNNDLGLSLYYGFPYYGRWIWSAARMLVDKNHVSLTELLEKIAEVYSSIPAPEQQLLALAHTMLSRGLLNKEDLARRMNIVRFRLEAR